MRDLKSPSQCDNPIAGRSETCCESFRDHVKTIIEIERELLRVSSEYASSEYSRYLIEELGPCANYVRRSVLDVNSLVALFHDIGKCTLQNQQSLKKRGTAPHHEFYSVRLLEAAMSVVLPELDECLAFKALAPAYLAILLHHHSIRGKELKNIKYELEKRSISDYRDIECSWKCLSSAIDLVPGLYINRDLYVRRVASSHGKIADYIGGLVHHVPTESSYQPKAYRVAVLLSSVLLVADVMAAKLNRELCLTKEERDKTEVLRAMVKSRGFADSVFVEEFLKREELIEKCSKLLAEIK